MTAMATHMMKKQIADVGVPEVPEFLEQIVASGGHLWACRMSADMMHLTEADLYGEVEGIISAADFIERPTAPNCCSSDPTTGGGATMQPAGSVETELGYWRTTAEVQLCARSAVPRLLHHEQLGVLAAVSRSWSPSSTTRHHTAHRCGRRAGRSPAGA
jgi:hypothetical protein